MGLLDFLGKAAGATGGGIIKSISDVVDKFITTDAEKDQAKQELVKIIADYDANKDEEITKRLQADMTSDSWLSKNIRPMVMIFILSIYTLFAITSGNIAGFTIDKAFVELLGQWGMLIMSFYFGSRGLEKIFAIVNRPKEEK